MHHFQQWNIHLGSNFHALLLDLFPSASLKGYFKHFVFLTEVLGLFQAAQNLIPSCFTGSLPGATIDKITHLHYPGNTKCSPSPFKQSLSFLVRISQAPSSIPVVFEYEQSPQWECSRLPELHSSCIFKNIELPHAVLWHWKGTLLLFQIIFHL